MSDIATNFERKKKSMSKESERSRNFQDITANPKNNARKTRNQKKGNDELTKVDNINGSDAKSNKSVKGAGSLSRSLKGIQTSSGAD